MIIRHVHEIVNPNQTTLFRISFTTCLSTPIPSLPTVSLLLVIFSRKSSPEKISANFGTADQLLCIIP